MIDPADLEHQGFVDHEVIHTLTEPLSRDLRPEQDDPGVIHHPAVYKPGEEPVVGREPTLYELGILMAFMRLGKAIYEGTAPFDPGRKRKRKARQAAQRHQRG